MLSTKQAAELAALSDRIHEQMLREYGSSADAPTALAHRALHRLLTGMVNGEDTSGHVRMTFAAPTGFGKSSACAAFLIAAHQLDFLGTWLSVTYAASRVSQLYDFESVLLDNGIPATALRSVVSVLHGSKAGERGVLRACDTDVSVPVLLITHEKMRGVYRRGEGSKEKDLCYFLKYKGLERSLVLWDERCSATESKSVKVGDLSQAVAGLVDAHGQDAAYSETLKWFQFARTSIREHGTIPDCSPEQQQAFYQNLLASRCLVKATYITLRDFLESLRFTPKVFDSEQNGQGIIHYKVILPDQANRVLNLDASYSISELSKIGSKHPQGFVDAETVSPELKDMYRLYGKRLKDLRDCSTHTMIHWNKGCGKDIVERDAQAYLDNKAIGGNVILEMLEIVRCEVEKGKAVAVWTHSKGMHGTDLQRSVGQCLRKAGLLDGLTPQQRPQVVIDNYGQHDATNKYSYTQVAVLLGVMRRHECELAGAICGESRDIERVVNHAEVRKVKVADVAVTILQTIGRSCGRNVVNGTCEPQTSYMIYPNSKGEDITAVLRPQFPKARWEAYRPRFAVVSMGVTARWVEKVLEYLDRQPSTVKKISSRTLKVEVGASVIAANTWTRIINQVCEQSSNVTRDHKNLLMGDGEIPSWLSTSTPWRRAGQSVVRVDAEFFGFTVEAA